MITSVMGIKKLENIMVKMLRKLGVAPSDAEAIAWVYAVMTLRGVGHHDITGFPGLLRNLENRILNPRPRIRTTVDRNAVAVMDGDNAPGALAAYRMTQKAIKKAARYGVGMVSIRNSNHFLGAAPYALLAARHQMLGIAVSNTALCMGTGSSKDRAIGNNPWGFAVNTGAGFPILLDIANAYASYGKLHEYKVHGWEIPEEWGMDGRGRKTTDPARVIDGGVPLPIGGHKGFGIAVLMEILTAVLSGGAITDDVSLTPKGGNGSSQAALVINIEHFMPTRRFRSRTRRMVEHLKAHPPLDPKRPVILPGERSHSASKKIKKEGVKLSKRTVDSLNQWLEKLGMRA